ncbi:response regulator transcription factor, partial [Nonomuraea sp. MG754425]|uniref:response regulator transcription factor n=1 Tax=Nonomuraea sp. MG754425 TaxID=2570319 RepID=UPI001F2FFB25
MLRVLIVDDHPVVREGLRGMLEREPDIEVVGEAGSGGEAVAVVPLLRPDVVLMDLRMPG